jgi:hypothetical protein
MRRQEQEITCRHALDELLRQATVLHLALHDEGRPYVLPLSYGYDGRCLYLHCAPEGRKIDLLRRCPKVAFAVVVSQELQPQESPCAWGFRYQSILGEGLMHFVETPEETIYGLNVLMRQYGGQGGGYTPESLQATLVLRLEITSLTGKQSGY